MHTQLSNFPVVGKLATLALHIEWGSFPVPVRPGGSLAGTAWWGIEPHSCAWLCSHCWLHTHGTYPTKAAVRTT